MAPSHLLTALAALSHSLLEQFPGLRPFLPSWWSEQTAETETAVRWATHLTTGRTNPIHPLLPTYPQRATIFSRLFASTPTPDLFVPLTTLALQETAVFPASLLPQNTRQTHYTALLHTLETGLQTLQPLTNPRHYLLELYDLLRRTTWCLPSPYADAESGISLFDHSRVAAALAPCYQPTFDTANAQTPVACLVNGDLSGIQSFIYTITARGATAGLRGRSFYLQLLTEGLAAHILETLHLPPTSLLYAGGGHFFLVAPAETDKKLPDLRRHLSELLLRHHQGELYLALGAAPFTAKDFAPAHFADAWSGLSSSINQVKRQRFSELGEAMYAQVFAPQGQGGRQDNDCSVCHYEGKVEIDPERLDDTGRPIRKCLLCGSLETLGQELRQAQGVWVQTVPPVRANRSTWRATLRELGWDVRIITSGERLAGLAGTAADTQLWAFDEKTAESAHRALPHLPVLRHPLVNVTPTVTPQDIECHPKIAETEQLKPYNVKPFTLLQAQAKGIDRLGVLRMDVDDLGTLFSQGFGESAGLAQTAALSFALSYYFEGWVGYLAEQASNGRDVVYSIYSGGDDLFMVGAWDVLPHLAYSITQDLSRYAAHNPNVHASAGITLHGSKYPLYQAAREAEAALERAKSYHQGQQRKNAFTFLGRTRPWGDYPTVYEEFQFLKRLRDEKKAPQQLLQLLLRLDTLYLRHRQQQLAAGRPAQQVYWGPSHWWSVYQLNRMAKQNTAVREELEHLRQKLSGQGFSHIELLGLSARWAELQLREKPSRTSQQEARDGE